MKRRTFILSTLAAPAVAGTREAGQFKSLGFGLAAIADWSTQHPFLNIIKSCRPWTGQIRGRRQNRPTEELEPFLDAQGWPMLIPPDLASVDTWVLASQPAGVTSIDGRYRLTWDGQGELELGGRVHRQSPSIFQYSVEDMGNLRLRILKTKPGNHIRNIAIVRTEFANLLDAGEIFNPTWLALLKNAKAIRFMDWQKTNGSPVSEWADRTSVQNYTYRATGGVPIEMMVALANRLNASPWFNMPHLATDDFIRKFAHYVRDNLNPELVSHVEYSNEFWNRQFAQGKWGHRMALARWGGDTPTFMSWYGMQAQRSATIWGDAFAGQMQRLNRIVATQTARPGLEYFALEAPDWVAEGHAAPRLSFDTYAVTGYFGIHDIKNRTPDILKWSRSDIAADIRKNQLPRLLTKLWPYHQKVAAKHGLKLSVYEGGTHVVGVGKQVKNQTLTTKFLDFNFSRECAEIYDELLDNWGSEYGGLFVHFVDVAQPSRWGSWGALRHLNDANPRWRALQRFL